MKICRFGISDQVFCLFSLVQVYCCEYNKKFWNSQPKIALFWKCKNMLMSAHILGIFFLKWLLNLCYPLQKTVVPQNILILPPNIENKWKKSFLEQSKLCPCWGTVGGGLAESKILLSEKTEIFLDFFFKKGGGSHLFQKGVIIKTGDFWIFSPKGEVSHNP